jgi:ABC-type multidrug transport system fused ATPase/permease subunit
VTLAALSLVVVPFLYVSLRHYSGRMVDRNERVASLESSLVARAYETLASIAVVKSFARERHELDRFVRAGAETMRARLDLTLQEAWLSVWVSAITLGGTALVLAVGGMHVLQGSLTVGSLLVAIAYLGAVYNPLSSIAHTIATLQHARVSARRVRDILALAPEPFDVPGAVPAARVRGDIRFDGVHFGYEPNRPILENVTFHARPGELVAIVGLTGAGKTTLARLLLRFLEPTSGSISIDGLNLGDYDLRGLRERIAMVPQEPVLFEGTIAENVRYGRLEATNAEVEAAARAAQLHDFVSRLPHGYETPVAEAGATLSGGERQRIGIARALLKDAPILMLDEPTSSLDAVSEGRVFEALARLREGRTTLVIAHRLSTIRDASRILVLDGGRLAAQGTHDQLLASNALYRRMCARLALGRSLEEPGSVDELLQVP